MFLDGWEEQLRSMFGSRLRIVEENKRVIVYVNTQPISESAMRELACKYALDDIHSGAIKVFADTPEQLPLMGM